jgi:transcriptional regulator with XRE-family HTH domain
MPDETIGKRIRRMYEAKGLKRYGFAKRLGVAYTTVNNWERDENPATPELETLKRVADLLGCAVSDLTGPGSQSASAPVASEPETHPDTEHLPTIVVEFLSSGQGGHVTPDERAALASYVTRGAAFKGGFTLEKLGAFLRALRAGDTTAPSEPRRDEVEAKRKEQDEALKAKGLRKFGATAPAGPKKR